MCGISRFSQLPVSLTIQLVGSDKHGTVFLAGGQDNHICGDSLVGFYFDNMSHFDIFAHDLHWSRFGDMYIGLTIGLLISFLSVVIVDGFFDEREP